MIVKELIEILLKLDQEKEVCAIDPYIGNDMQIIRVEQQGNLYIIT